MSHRTRVTACASAVCFALTTVIPMPAQSAAAPGNGIKRVLLVSVDGMHALDLVNCVTGISGVNNGAAYCPNIAALGKNGINYLQASASKPSDSFPGLMALVSGGSPKTVGAFYDVAYDRVLAPPAVTTGNGLQAGTCTVGVPNGTTTEYEEGIDKDQTQLNGGAMIGDGGINSIDSQRLIRDPNNNCAPVYPWNFVRTNTIFGVIHNAGMYTAWSDKHPAYSAVAGPGSGNTLDDYYSPEINSTVVGLPGVRLPSGQSCATILDPTQTGSWTDSFQNIQCYDTLKVNAVLNEIDGKNHQGSAKTQVPAIFGMNFQAVSVGEKLIEANVGTGGYLDAYGTPTSFLLSEMQFVDASIGTWVAELKKQNLLNSTLIIITAKHGQSPIDPNLYSPHPGPNGTNGTTPATLLASLLPVSESPTGNGIGPTEDDVSLLWLANASNTSAAATTLEQNAAAIGLGEIYAGPSLSTMFNLPGLPPSGDPRTPDIIVTPNVGVTYTGSSKKLAEHGGFSHDDTNVVMLLSNPSFSNKTVTVQVETTQVAPSILKALGLNPISLQAVDIEGTPELPQTPF